MTNKDIEKELSEKKIRPTAMRTLVLKALMESKVAISLSDLEIILDSADKSTIFRTLKTFEEKRLIHKIDDGSGSIKYALCQNDCTITHEDFHVHFQCRICKQIYCLNEITVPEMKLPVGFSFEDVSMIVKGVCTNCKS